MANTHVKKSVRSKSRRKSDVQKLRSLGRNIRKLREGEGLSQEELAFKSGLDRTYVSGIERGVRNPTALSLFKIAGALSQPVSELFDSKA